MGGGEEVEEDSDTIMDSSTRTTWNSRRKNPREEGDKQIPITDIVASTKGYN